MVRAMRAIPPILMLLLVACNGPADEPVPADGLPGEEEALADAEAMIDENTDRIEQAAIEAQAQLASESDAPEQ